MIANVPKTVVNYVLDWLYETTHWEGIRLTLLKPATAELAEDQEDERELMPFPVLDACFALFAGEKMSPDEVSVALKAVFPEHAPERLDDWAARFVRLFSASIYKWVAGSHLDSRGQPRSRARARPAASGRAARRVAQDMKRATKTPRDESRREYRRETGQLHSSPPAIP